MNDFNVEFGHIYSDQEFGKEQIQSIQRAKKVLQDLEKRRKSFTTVVLIDEYSPIVSTLEETQFLKEMGNKDLRPDFIAYESNLTAIADKIIESIPKIKLKTESIKGKKVLILITDKKRIGLKDNLGRHTCSMLIAAWILARLGLFDIPIKKYGKSSFPGKKLITILPEKYRETEKKVLEILEVTKYKKEVKKVRYEFF